MSEKLDAREMATRLNEIMMDAPSLGSLLVMQARIPEDEAETLAQLGYAIREDRVVNVMTLLNMLFPPRASGSGQLCAVCNEMTGAVLQVIEADRRSLPSSRILALRESHEALTELPQGVKLPPDRYTGLGFIITDEDEHGQIETGGALQGEGGQLLRDGDHRGSPPKGLLGGGEWCDRQVQGHACVSSQGGDPAPTEDSDPEGKKGQTSRALW